MQIAAKGIANVVIAVIVLVSTSVTCNALSPNVVSVRLLAPSPVSSLGSPTLELESVLTNTSDDVVDISTDGIAYGVKLTRYVEGKPADTASVIKDIEPRSWVRILPHQSIVVPFTYQMKVPNLKIGRITSTPGLYAIRVMFAVFVKGDGTNYAFEGSVQSNEVMFLISPDT